MLGNDVIDLADPETHSRHPGFDARVFGARERRSIAASADPHAMRQMLWAAKESAYKAARRRDARVVFSPIRFEVELDARGRGRVRHAAGLFRVEISRDGDCIHAVARLGGDPARSHAGVTALAGREAGAAARGLALRAMSDALRVPLTRLCIERRGRIPELRLCGEALPTALTLSHHGRYAAYAALT